ncbi:hypothetical protein [Legionella jamestowniensis]|uniref:Uncharacterized protein n=1 Tax=Legionella jamestowniensis TaxID=455 RepID=A0A0W0UN48_9GAMM|nr:hypothetical protein [Legionella jamestowniensis]KTD09291.1 hypothetical protein Ljam_0641 [Legionella jamestowniensis]OCH99137.1 hypothetical protein A8135_07730 [Legionella jamestowniensis]SFL87140.1 hypothetical protein SAMN02746073_2306 [Legionella jamestowniensis DSM 19215]
MGTLEKKDNSPVKEAFNDLIQAQSARAMHYLLLHDQNNYDNEINKLAQSCSNVLQQPTITSDFVVNLMEKSMTSSYLEALKNIQHTIEQCKEKKDKIVVNSFYGEKEAASLSKRIAVLEKSKTIAPPVIMEQVVRDVLTQAVDKYNSVIDRPPYP